MSLCHSLRKPLPAAPCHTPNACLSDGLTSLILQPQCIGYTHFKRMYFYLSVTKHFAQPRSKSRMAAAQWANVISLRRPPESRWRWSCWLMCLCFQGRKELLVNVNAVLDPVKNHMSCKGCALGYQRSTTSVQRPLKGCNEACWPCHGQRLRFVSVKHILIMCIYRHMCIACWPSDGVV